MGRFLLGCIVGVCATFGGAYLFVVSGGVPMSASAKPLPFERTIANAALRASDRGARDARNPLVLGEDELVAGARVYATHCAMCHGRPGHSSELATNMFPAPPQLFSHDGMVTDDPEGITHWKVSNGIRLSGMPGFTTILSGDQRWQVTMLLKHADHLSERVRNALTAQS